MLNVEKINTLKGYQVTHAGTDVAFPARPGLWAGVVAGRDIPPGEFGSIQCWGHCDFVLIQGNTNAPFVTIPGTTDGQFTNKLLRPMGCFGGYGTTNGAATNAGYMGFVTAGDIGDPALGGYAELIDGVYTQAGYGTVGTDMVSLDAGDIHYGRAFIRAI